MSVSSKTGLAATRPPRRSALAPWAAIALLLGALADPSAAAGSPKDCSLPPPDLTPLDEMAPGETYHGFLGGIYPNESNTIPTAHHDAGLIEASMVVPRDALGNPDCDFGRIGVISLGTSVTHQAFNGWAELYSNYDPNRNPAVMLIDGTAGGQSVNEWAEGLTPTGTELWDTVVGRVNSAGLTREQVQVAYVFMASPDETPFPTNALDMVDAQKVILQRLRDEFPNCRLAYMNSLHYLGFSTEQILPGRQEPYAYEDGWAVKWTIEAQINGEPGTSYTAGEMPWLAWAPYTWANVATAPGELWECDDYGDSTHLSPQGKGKIALMFDQFFNSEPTATMWYHPIHGCQPSPAPLGTRYGTGCYWTNEVLPRIETDQCGPPCNEPFLPNALPYLGNKGFRVKVVQPGGAGRPAVVLMSVLPITSMLDQCSVFVDPGALFAFDVRFMNSNGSAAYEFPIPGNPALVGLHFYAQWFVGGIGSNQAELILGTDDFSATRGMDFRLGW